MALFRSKKLTLISVKVLTFDSELEFDLENGTSGRNLFDLVCRTIGLRESWYFGLQYKDSLGRNSWLKMDKKVKDQKLNIKDGFCVFNFYAKFFPENVNEELVQEITQHLFFLQVKQSILSMDIYCRPEASVLLASYAVHVQFGPYDFETYKDGMLADVDLLPRGVVDQYQMTPQMWEERIKTWYMDHEPMTQDEVEMEYLKIAQDLDMYGVNYFAITVKLHISKEEKINKNETKLWLGVTAIGLYVYEEHNKLTPKTTFQWSEIRHVSFNDKKFKIKFVDSKVSNFVFFSQDLHINKLILDLCKGNHDLYMRRRKQDSMEIQQMKTQAKEEKQRRQAERTKLLREKKLREQAEKDRRELEGCLQKLKDEMKAANDALRRSEEAKELYFEKNRVNEEQMQLTEYKANHFKIEMIRLRGSNLKAESEKEELEKKIQIADFCLQKLKLEKEKREAEAEKLKKELVGAKISEREATTALLSFLNKGVVTSPELTRISHNHSQITNSKYNMLSKDFVISADEMKKITNEIEQNRLEYLRKSNQVQKQLQTLRSEIELLKIEENQNKLDVISTEKIKSGETKYSTLKKLKSGSTKARVAFFEEL